MKFHAAFSIARLALAGLLATAGLFACEPGVDADAEDAAPTQAHAPTHDAAAQGGTNRLAAEASPYLQLHAHNPVDWYPWGEEAFAKALVEDKPIFLSIGYSTCYWCHVMEREVFANEEIAALMNETVVSVKVDREERPDIDEIYMTATRLLSGSGGWPNSLFLTPDRKPFYAGTYIPPEDRRGRMGFPKLLARISDGWTNDRQRLIDRASRIAARIAQGSTPDAEQVELPSRSALLERVRSEFRTRYEPVHGGFSTRTKFPRPPMLELLLTVARSDPTPEISSMLQHTLDEMALGGIYDHVGGGFHRYSTEATWSVPHFEKMLYDNAQLVGLYAGAYAATGRPLYKRVVAQTLAYLDREMRLPGGGLASAQDAEVAGHEGASYVWTREEITAVLGAERAAQFLAVYELVPLEGGPAGALRVRLSAANDLERFAASDIADLLSRFEPDLAKLLAVRDARVQPLRDDKVIAAWNALAISGFVRAADALDDPAVLRSAEETARFVLQKLRGPDAGLHRSTIAGQVRENGVFEDYALLADALLALRAATGDPEWEREARSLVDAMLERFADPDPGRGGLFDTHEDTELFARLKGFEDSVLPSGNGVGLRVLRRLAAAEGAERYALEAQRSLAAFAPWFARSPTRVASATGEFFEGPRDATLAARTAGIPTPASDLPKPMPRSEDQVTASATLGSVGGLLVQVRVADGWHINANPASLEFLVPTAVETASGAALKNVAYPPGEVFSPEFAPTPISVYQGEFTILVRDPNLETVPLRIRLQACDEQRCLPPGSLEVDAATRE